MASIYPLVIFLVLFVSVSATTTISTSRISEPLLLACQKTPEPDTCIKYLKKFPGSSTGDIQNITAISVRAGSFLAKEIKNLISILRTEASFVIPVFQKCLTSSTVAFKDIVATFGELTEAVQERDFASASLWAAGAWQDVTTAEKSCTANNGTAEIAPLSGYIGELKKLLRIIQALLRFQKD